jgi:hypothetical protein
MEDDLAVSKVCEPAMAASESQPSEEQLLCGSAGSYLGAVWL